MISFLSSIYPSSENPTLRDEGGLDRNPERKWTGRSSQGRESEDEVE